MRILAVTTRSPFPLVEGRALRTFNLLRQAARRHEIYLATYLQSTEELEGLDRLREFCTEVRGIPLYMNGSKAELLGDLARDVTSRVPFHAIKYRRAEMLAQIRKWMAAAPPDVVHLDMLHLAEIMPAVADCAVVLVEHNVETQIVERRIGVERNPLTRAYWRFQHRKLAPYEKAACEAADWVVTVSDVDGEALRALAPAGRYTTVSNGVDSEFFSPAAERARSNQLVYVGGLSWFPNLDAMRFFCAEILPLIAAEVPDVSLKVVGRVPTDALKAEFEKYPQVELLGLVDDIRPVIDASAVYVVPLRVGGGTRLKILDALSMAKGLVTTSIGSEGLEVQSGRDLLIADDPRDFARSVVGLLKDPGRARQLGDNGRQLVQRCYDWSSIGAIMNDVYEAARARHSAGSGGGAR
jgi:glycosyltransferase involved in cell wall biosynthesis